MSSKARNTTSGVATGAGAGALSGAGVGASIGSVGTPIGTAIGALVGAVIGGVAGGVKSRNDYENQQEEVKRVEKREDSAIRRQVLDSQLAGLNVGSDAPPTGASASSVAPVQTPETISDIVGGANNFANALFKKTQLEQQQNLSALDLLFKQYDKIQQDSYNNLLASQKELDDITYKFRNTYTTENHTQTETDERLLNSTQRLNEKLHSATFTDSEIKYWRDNFISHVVDSTENTEKTGVQGDFGAAIIGAIDNFLQSSHSVTETRPFAETVETNGGTISQTDKKGKQRKDKDQRKKSLKGSLSNSSEDKTISAQNFDYEKKGGDENRDEHHSNTLTDNEINTIIRLYQREKLKKDIKTNKTAFQGYDLDARLKYVENYNYLYNKRSEFYKRATMTPTEYINPRWDATKELIKFLNF